jgi:hypothetical protein
MYEAKHKSASQVVDHRGGLSLIKDDQRLTTQLYRDSNLYGDSNLVQESEVQNSLMERTHKGLLTSSEVSMPVAKLNLNEFEVSSLQTQASHIQNPNASPLSDGLTSGKTHVENSVVKYQGMESVTQHTLPEALNALGAKEARVERTASSYQLYAKMNPWILVSGGKITNVDYGPWNKGMPLGWVFVKNADLTNAGVNPSNPINSSWPPSSNPFTTPSATFSGFSIPPSFNSLPVDQLPSMPDGYAWNKDASTGDWGAYRNPVQRPSSPTWGIEAEDLTGSNLFYTSWEEDPTPSYPSNVKPLSAFAQTRPKGGGYGGSRSYPMTTQDYYDPSGTKWGRGHAVDHFDGSTTTTTSSWNFVPEDRDFNQGARNSLVQSLRPGGSYSARYEYAPTSTTPLRTNDGSQVPVVEHFSTFDSGGTQTYYQVPNQSYPSSRKKSAADPFIKPNSQWP